MSAELAPFPLVDEVFGEHVVFAARPHSAMSRWLPRGNEIHDSMAMSHSFMLGSSPMLYPGPGRRAREDLEFILGEAGIELVNPWQGYEGEDGYFAVLCRYGESGWRIAPQYACPTEVLPARYWLFEPTAFSHMNNKQHLEDYVPEAFLPERRLIAGTVLETWRQDGIPFADREWPFGLPLVLKAATDEGSGGGIDVAIVSTPEGLREAMEQFADQNELVLERYYEFRENLCLNFASMQSGEIRYLGAAWQITKDGMFQGSRIWRNREVSERAIEAGLEVGRRAWNRGFRGYFGVDAGVEENGQVRVYDLNFRINSSTPMIYLWRYSGRAQRFTTARSLRFVLEPGGAEAREALVALISEGCLIPFGFLVRDVEGGTTRILGRAVILGNSNEELEETVERVERISQGKRWGGYQRRPVGKP